MNVDIDHLDLESLYTLNDRVIERIKFLEHARAHLSMMAFNLGARVSFETAEGRQFGRLVKYNRKTVNIDTEDGRRWRIPPHMLSEVKDVAQVKAPSHSRTRKKKKQRKKKSR
jgi:hypothetical protein